MGDEEAQGLLVLGVRADRVLRAPTAAQVIETWAPIPGYDGWYEASDLGRIRTWRKRRWPGRRDEPVLLNISPNNKGYLRVNLLDSEGRWEAKMVHQMVLLAFVGPRPHGYHGAHRDGNRTNNRLSNLYWATPKQNGEDAARHGRNKGESHPQARLTEEIVREIRARRATGETLVSIAGEFSISTSMVSAVALRQVWRHVA